MRNGDHRSWSLFEERGDDPETSHLLITVEDSGTGIDPKDLDSILEPFLTTKSNRMGMGLSICRSIIFNRGGRLAVAYKQARKGGARATFAALPAKSPIQMTRK
jgi:C4-dicarboxylate-specific signal transduction histidine kinase